MVGCMCARAQARKAGLQGGATKPRVWSKVESHAVWWEDIKDTTCRTAHLDLNICGLPLGATKRLMDHDSGVGEAVALALQHAMAQAGFGHAWVKDQTY